MAERWGGRWSPRRPLTPEEAERAEARRVDAAGARANLLMLPPFLASFTGLWGGPATLVLSLLAAAALWTGARLLREGLRAAAAHEARPASRRPALPRKALAALLAGLGAALAALSGGTGAAGSLLVGAAALGLHLAAFGLDPWPVKDADGAGDRVARVVAEAERTLQDLRARVAALGDRALDARVAAFEALARRMIRAVEEDPRDLPGARRHLSVYLQGARDATARFADLYARTGDARARADYEALLSDLQREFAARTEAMRAGGREALDVEIAVLRDRLAREGGADGPR